MLCYKDRTFCAAKSHKGCGREATEEDIMAAEKIGTPIAYGNFCTDEDLDDLLAAPTDTPVKEI